MEVSFSNTSLSFELESRRKMIVVYGLRIRTPCGGRVV
jgi:hypothetical protein